MYFEDIRDAIEELDHSSLLILQKQIEVLIHQNHKEWGFVPSVVDRSILNSVKSRILRAKYLVDKYEIKISRALLMIDTWDQS